jgi:16S rRNA (cytidine1402-2'-O)-methyltransferase
LSAPAQAGVLYVVATPIGNLEDLSARALRILGEVDIVCCEDTRHTGQLLAHEQVTAHRLVSLHLHNESSRIETLLEELSAGKSVALVSDAGTPLVSDPGERLVAAAAAAGITVQAVPGPSAVLAALVVSGFEVERFNFEGFLPRKGKERSERLVAIAALDAPSVLYESPQRIETTLRDLAVHCGDDRLVSVSRELTKLHEETWRGPLGDAPTSSAASAARGEYVLVVSGAAGGEPDAPPDLARVFTRLKEAGLRRRDAVAAVEVLLDVPHRVAYEAALATPDLGDSDTAEAPR